MTTVGDGLLTEPRRKLYDRLASQIGGTPLVELRHIDVPNDCRIFCKAEHLNPTGSHYDRETLALLRGFEAAGEITPGPEGKPLLETTTGSSGASLAWLCRVLGFRCRIIIPEDMPAARIHQIASYGGEIERSPRGLYIGGLVTRLRTVLRQSAKNDYAVTNHAKDVVYGPQATAELAKEILQDLEAVGCERPDYFVCMFGTGITANGISKVLTPLGTRLVVVEPRESPTITREHFPAVFCTAYPEGHTDERHKLYGTAVGQDAGFEFPNTTAAAPGLSDVRLVDEDQWRRTQRDLMDLEAFHVGNSSAACVWGALDLAATLPARSTILTLFYDAAWRYLPLDTDAVSGP